MEIPTAATNSSLFVHDNYIRWPIVNRADKPLLSYRFFDLAVYIRHFLTDQLKMITDIV